MTIVGHPPADVSPTLLSYTAALRGIAPRAPEMAFTYARLRCRDVYALIGMAASNPEGRFFGVVADVNEVAKAESIARARKVKNVAFLADLAFQLLSQQNEAGAPPMPPLDYLIVDETDGDDCSADDHAAYLATAGKYLKPGGIFALRYQAYDSADTLLDFLIETFDSLASPEQARIFLEEIQALGGLYLKQHPETAQAIQQAADSSSPETYLRSRLQNAKPKSGAIDLLSDMLPRNFFPLGSARIAENYRDLATPELARPILEKCEKSVLYEPLKDFAMDRLVRHDVWCRLPATTTNDPTALFGRFLFGIAKLTDRQPAFVQAHDQMIDLRQPLLKKMIDLLATLPMSIGDFLSHPDGKDTKPEGALEAMQLLVACGVARPIRSPYRSASGVQLSQLKWSLAFNRYLNDTPITDANVLLASEIIGDNVLVPARDALVMQAINRVGLKHSVSALLPELERIAHTPALACQIMDTAEPTAESARNMIATVVQQSMVPWHAYGLLAA